MPISTEADTCRKYVLPRLQAAGWDTAPHSIAEQRTFTDGRIVVAGNRIKRRPQKRADYILRYTRDLPIAVVEAKREYATPGAGLQQAKDYAEVLGLKFAYATNGHGIVEFDYLTGREQLLDAFPTPDELWQRLKAGEGLNGPASSRPAASARGCVASPGSRSWPAWARLHRTMATVPTPQPTMPCGRHRRRCNAPTACHWPRWPTALCYWSMIEFACGSSIRRRA